jgi:NitT/TauT family transport system permease protein
MPAPRPTPSASGWDRPWLLGSLGIAMGTSRLICQLLEPLLGLIRCMPAAAWNLVIVAELVAANEGLGKRISLAQRFLRTDEIFVGLIAIGLIGLAIDLGFRLLLRRSCRWAT